LPKVQIICAWFTAPSISATQFPVIDLEELVGAEWAEWYRLTPAQRWLESEKLWQTYLALGGSLEPEPDTQSPFYDPQAPSPRAADGRAGVRVPLPPSLPQEMVERLWLQRMRTVKTKAAERQTAASSPKHHKALVSAIQKREVLRFFYEGYERIVEPQTYGMSFTGRHVFRALQTDGASGSGQTRIAKLFDVAKISKFTTTGQHFKEALPSHNPQDSAMKEVYATLPKPARK
jgi:hypothetical protein